MTVRRGRGHTSLPTGQERLRTVLRLIERYRPAEAESTADALSFAVFGLDVVAARAIAVSDPERLRYAPRKGR